MADILEYMNSRPQWLDERLELSREALARFLAEADGLEGLTAGAFLQETAHFLQDVLRVFDLKEALVLEELPPEQQKGVWEQLVYAPVWQRLSGGPVCPGDEALEALLRAAAREWRLAGGCGFQGRKLSLIISLELFLQLVQLFEMEQKGEESRGELTEAVRQALYYHFSDYSDVTAAQYWQDVLRAGAYTEAIETSGPEDLFGFYCLSWPCDENTAREAQREAKRLMGLSEAELLKEAKACVEAGRYLRRAASEEALPQDKDSRDGACQAGEALAAVKVYPGRERLARCICGLLRAQGYEPVCFQPAETMMSRAAAGERPEELFLFLDRALKERRVAEEKNALEVYRQEAARLACAVCAGRIAGQGTEPGKDADSAGQNGEDGAARRQEKIYREFCQEISAVRQKFFSGY